jgi:hypothetical protein
MSIPALRGRSLRMLSAALSGGAGVVLLLGAAASPSSAGDTPAGTAVVAGVRAAASGGSWGLAKEVAAALNTGGDAQINSVSCAAPGNCSAGGTYIDNGGGQHVFVVNETNGTWGKATQVATGLNTNGYLNSVSCAAAGNCSAGGLYVDLGGGIHAFVVNETNGIWGKATEVTGGNTERRSV